MRSSQRTVTIQLKVTEGMKEKLVELADKDSRDLSGYVRMILNKVISGEIKL